MNLATHVGDVAACVQANRLLLQKSIDAQPIFLQQTHGVQVLKLQLGAAHDQVADACVTNQPGLACTVMVADCLPVLLAHTSVPLVAAAHAGWRGLLGDGARSGVLETVFRDFVAQAQEKEDVVASKIIAWLGPCIGPGAFEVGPEVRQAFVKDEPATAYFFKPLGMQTYLADLPGLARWRLRRLGIEKIYGNDGSLSWCTVSQPSQFFSYRRDAAGSKGQATMHATGRMAGCVWLLDT